MVARKLRIESLEVRRLFAIDLDSANADASTDISNAAISNETADSAAADETLLTATSNTVVTDSVAAPYSFAADRLAGPIAAYRFAGPVLGETDEYAVVARPEYSTGTSNLYISKRQANGTALETSVLKIDNIVSSIYRLGDKFVLYAREYFNNPLPDSPFISWSNSRLYVVDPASREIVFETQFSGQVLRAAELPTSLVLEATPSYSLNSWTQYSPDFSVVGNAEGVLATPELVFLHETEDGFQLHREQFVEAHAFHHFDNIVVSFTKRSRTDPNSPLSALKFWDISNNQLREIDSIDFAPVAGEHESMYIVGRSPDGTRLLLRHSSFGLVNDSYVSEVSLVLVDFSQENASVVLNFVPPPNFSWANWISDHQILVGFDGEPTNIQILDISDLSRPTLNPITPSIAMKVTHYKLLESGHLALLGHTPGTAYIIADTMNGYMPRSTGYDDGPIHGALVIVDLQQNKITDEKILEPHSRVVQQFSISGLPNHFAFRTITSLPDYSSHETVHVATVDEQGKIAIVDEAKLGSDWTEQSSNGSTLSILEYHYLELRSWSDIGQKLWRIDFEAIDSGVGPDIASTTPVAPQENLRGAIGELLRTTAIPHDIPLDTNGDGIISPIDVLQVINHINRAYSTGETDNLLNIATNAVNRFDVDGDNKILPTDVMMMIASLNVVHANFDTNNEAPITTELPDEPRFWDKLAEEKNLSPDLVAASIETLFGNVLESAEASSVGDYWSWFAPLDPLADKLKQHWIGLNSNRVS